MSVLRAFEEEVFYGFLCTWATGAVWGFGAVDTFQVGIEWTVVGTQPHE